MKPRFLIDENLSREIVTGMRQHNLSIDILHVGDPGTLPVQTKDPAILAYCEREHRILVTKNRKSMQDILLTISEPGTNFGES